MRARDALATAAVTLATLASATPARADFRWTTSDPSCPSAAEVEAAIERAAGSQRRDTGDLDARAAARRVESHYELHLETRDAAGLLGERDLQGNTCAQVADAAALVLALTRASTKAAPHGVSPSTEPRAPLETSPPIGIALRPEVQGSLGMLPGAALGFGLAVAVTRGRWRVEAQAEGWLPKMADAARAGTGGSIDLLGGGLRVCFRPLGSDAPVDASLCTGPSLGDEFGHGVDLRTVQDGGGVWAAWMVGLQGGVRLTSRLAIRGSIEAGRQMVAPTFVTSSSGLLFESDLWQRRAWLGLEIRLR